MLGELRERVAEELDYWLEASAQQAFADAYREGGLLRRFIAFEADRVRHRLPELVAALEDSPAGSWARAMSSHCTLLVDLVRAAGAELLHHPVRPPISALVEVWQSQWRAAIPSWTRKASHGCPRLPVTPHADPAQ
ncbi:hypothetical protein [Streptomyces incarnatus]|uniref:hypothetical protein n=1 Tax=Streptomyces incarnatus TaxID=665007 RepID=UPI0026D2139C